MRMPEQSEREAGPRATAEAEAERLRRQAREAAALRANLLRRKQQARARDAAATDGVAEPAGEDAGVATPCR